MKRDLHETLKEIYRADPALRGYEKELSTLITDLQARSKRNPPSPAFITSLRGTLIDLINKTHNQTTMNAVTKVRSFAPWWALGGAALAAVIIIPVVLLTQTNHGLPFSSGATKMSLAPDIESVGSNAFGSLTVQNSRTGADEATAPASADMSMPESTTDSTGSAVSGMSTAPGAGFGGGSGMMGRDAIYPVGYGIRYTYQGDPFTVDSDTVSVLRRIKGFAANFPLSQFLRSFSLSDINLSSFENSTLQSAQFSQNEKFGYSVMIDATNGVLSIGENWEQWYDPCTETGCPELPRLTLGDVPADEELIRLANDFVAEHNIDVSHYGEPQVAKEWRVYYDIEPNRDIAYIPDSMVVVYPLIVDGKNVHDESGALTGIRVNVNIRFDRVSGVWDVASQRYESSAYAAETDTDRIVAMAERGGVYGYVLPEGNTIEVSLGTPSTVYVKLWHYAQGRSSELVVPALSFPVLEQPKEVPYGRTAIIVPLARDLLVNAYDMPVPLPRPLIDAAQ